MSETYEMTEERMVRRVGDAIGYGRTMQLCEKLWREMLPSSGGELTTGPCASQLVECPHITIKSNKQWLNANGHCDWCCGTGRVTKRVMHAMKDGRK